MAYSVIVWLVDPGKHPQQDREEEWAAEGREQAPGAATGANLGYTLPRMRYGVYESQDEAEQGADDGAAPAGQRGRASPR